MMIPTMWNEGGPSGHGWSEIEAAARCPKEDQYARVRQITKPTSQTPDHFSIGSFVHAGRARWMADGFSLSDETWQRMQADMTYTRETLPLPSSDLAYSLALRYMQEYVEHWGIREKPKIVAVEHMLGPTELKEGDVRTIRTARLDDFGFYPEFGMGLAIGECKTTNGNISDVANQYTLAGQTALQQILWRLAPQGADTYGQSTGVVVDVIKKGNNGKKCEFGRIPIQIPERAQDWMQREIIHILHARAATDWNSDAARSPTMCTRLIGKARVACDFRDLCLFGKAGSIGYMTADGVPLSNWVQQEGQLVAPWE